MSEPVSSMDVEDVLSSIRRLVSEEAKGNPETEDTSKPDALSAIDDNIHEAAENAARDALEDVARQVLGEDEFAEREPPSNDFTPSEMTSNIGQKLVLTDALRVADESEPEPAAAAEAPSADPLAEPGRLRALLDADPLDSAQQVPLPNAAPTGASASSANENIRPLRPVQFESSPDDALFDRAKAAMDAAAFQKPRTGRRVNFSRTEPDMVETASALASEKEEVEGKAAVSLPEVPETATLAEEVPQSGSDKPEVPDPSPFAEAELGFADQAAVPIEDAEVIEEQPPEPAPESAEAAAMPEYAAEEEATTINFAEEDSILDEETLRDMVSDLVRSELQGELGDRITRNVRKLVRREIQRALATREFE